jgi:hypothetical protein
MNWEISKLFLIAIFKEDSSYCLLSKLPKDLIRLILDFVENDFEKRNKLIKLLYKNKYYDGKKFQNIFLGGLNSFNLNLSYFYEKTIFLPQDKPNKSTTSFERGLSICMCNEIRICDKKQKYIKYFNKNKVNEINGLIYYINLVNLCYDDLYFFMNEYYTLDELIRYHPIFEYIINKCFKIRKKNSEDPYKYANYGLYFIVNTIYDYDPKIFPVITELLILKKMIPNLTLNQIIDIL